MAMTTLKSSPQYQSSEARWTTNTQYDLRCMRTIARPGNRRVTKALTLRTYSSTSLSLISDSLPMSRCEFMAAVDEGAESITDSAAVTVVFFDYVGREGGEGIDADFAYRGYHLIA